MNSLPRRTTLPLNQTMYRRLRSLDWVEIVGFPCTAALMEGLPLMLVLWLTGLVLTGQQTLLVLDPITILLLLLGFHCLALALVIGMHLPLINDPLALFLVALRVLWCWQRGMRRSLANRREEYMKTVFQRSGLSASIYVLPACRSNAPLVSVGGPVLDEHYYTEILRRNSGISRVCAPGPCTHADCERVQESECLPGCAVATQGHQATDHT